MERRYDGDGHLRSSSELLSFSFITSYRWVVTTKPRPSDGLLAGYTGQGGPSSGRSKDHRTRSSNPGVSDGPGGSCHELNDSLKLQRDKMKQYQKRVSGSQ